MHQTYTVNPYGLSYQTDKKKWVTELQHWRRFDSFAKPEYADFESSGMSNSVCYPSLPTPDELRGLPGSQPTQLQLGTYTAPYTCIALPRRQGFGPCLKHQALPLVHHRIACDGVEVAISQPQRRACGTCVCVRGRRITPGS